MKRRIVLCADDYGQAPAISQGIINLIQKGRLSATSCMVNTDFWAQHAEWLAPFHQQIDIGLHFNLTEGSALSDKYRRLYGENFQSLAAVLRLALMRSFSQSAIEAELHAQIDRFQLKLGFMPDHIDGHQHIHQFPVIRAAVIKVYEQRLRAQNAYVRLINESLKMIDLIKQFKKIIIHATGTAAWERILKKYKIPHNESFAGIYSFGLAHQYPALFLGFLQKIGNQGLIMCHPGLEAVAANDVIAKARYAEYLYFAGDQFILDCQAQKVTIKRFK